MSCRPNVCRPNVRPPFRTKKKLRVLTSLYGLGSWRKRLAVMQRWEKNWKMFSDLVHSAFRPRAFCFLNWVLKLGDVLLRIISSICGQKWVPNYIVMNLSTNLNFYWIVLFFNGTGWGFCAIYYLRGATLPTIKLFWNVLQVRTCCLTHRLLDPLTPEYYPLFFIFSSLLFYCSNTCPI